MIHARSLTKKSSSAIKDHGVQKRNIESSFKALKDLKELKNANPKSFFSNLTVPCDLIEFRTCMTLFVQGISEGEVRGPKAKASRKKGNCRVIAMSCIPTFSTYSFLFLNSLPSKPFPLTQHNGLRKEIKTDLYFLP